MFCIVFVFQILTLCVNVTINRCECEIRGVNNNNVKSKKKLSDEIPTILLL